ncbi:MAG: glycosyltransferase [Dehalococcoidia bacterium]
MSVERVPPERRLRIAVLGDFDGVHTRSWLRWFIDRGHELHAISYYEPREPIDGVTLHVLRPGRRSSGGAAARRSAPSRVPRGAIRLVHAVRYWRAGLRRVVREIAPDVLHAHFLVEHGFYGMAARFHPYVVTAWGSDVLVEPSRDLASGMIARRVARSADLLTSNNAYMAERIVALGAPRDRVHVVTLGADRFFLDAWERSVNVRPPEPGRTPAVISTRAHEALYNVGEIIDAVALAENIEDTRLVVAHGGPEAEELHRRAAPLGGRVGFAGFLDQAAFRDALSDAEVFVSVPSSDGTSVALLQAMAVGCFPIVSDLPTQRELVEDGVNGFRVPLHCSSCLAEAIERALADPELRRRAAEANRRIVEERGLNETQMLRMEELFLSLLDRPAA